MRDGTAVFEAVTPEADERERWAFRDGAVEVRLARAGSAWWGELAVVWPDGDEGDIESILLPGEGPRTLGLRLRRLLSGAEAGWAQRAPRLAAALWSLERGDGRIDL